MRALVIEVGNTKVVVAEWRGTPASGSESLTRIREDATPSADDEKKEWCATLAQLFRQAGEPHVFGTSVVPEISTLIQSVASSCILIDHTVDFPFGLKIDEPHTVGADRFCNVAAAVQKGYRDALVVDLGTATTFDLLLDGDFVGGLIAPGMAFAARKLGETAARLSPVPFAPCPLEVGKNTAAAMQGGAYHVAVHGVLATVTALLGRYGERPVILTGGLAHYLDRPGWDLQPDWTLGGAAYLGMLTVSSR
jgi:type III pantothenate kinase